MSKPTKLFDLQCNGAVLIRKRDMKFINAMKNTYKKQAQYRGCVFTIHYNSTQS